MGGGTYSTNMHFARANASGYFTKSTEDIFKQKDLNSAMNPKGIKIRESRDSQEHPNALAIILALDVTGSMGHIPHDLIKKGLPRIMEGIIEAGLRDPQLLFLGIGDHICDSVPLQVGQFESSDELLDKWLESIYLEGGGGGNGGESYLLAWYFAANHTSIDCFEKRKKKGFLFTIGDDYVHDSVPNSEIKEIMGSYEASTIELKSILNKAQEKYNVYHIHLTSTGTGARIENIENWKALMGENVIFLNDYTKIPQEIAKIVVSHEKTKLNNKINVDNSIKNSL